MAITLSGVWKWLRGEDVTKKALVGEDVTKKELVRETPPAIPNLPRGRSSIPPPEAYGGVADRLNKHYSITPTPFRRDIIPIIRKLCMTNPDMSQSLQNIINLGNTGHKIHFDRNVEDSDASKMRNHIVNKHREWAAGQAGADGVVNRMLAQLMIGGALSNEWVPSPDLKTIQSLMMVNPEEIFWVYNKRKLQYEPYQRLHNGVVTSAAYSDIVDKTQLRKLNPLTYKYFALNGDTEIPYGFPPYMAALEPICTQIDMNQSIKYVIKQLGLLGFLEVLITAPVQRDGQSDEQYNQELEKLLITAKARAEEGFKDGTVVGIKEAHSFEFKSIARDFSNVVELFKQNELQVASALKQDPTLWGRDYNTSESQISVIFMKMLAELKNAQNIVKTNLEYGYALELRLQGYKFNYLTVEFNRSTIQDDLKYQQAMEIKIRNAKELYIMGTISEYLFANEVGYEAPDQPKPRVPIEMLVGGKSPGDEAKDKQDREKKKDASDRKVRDKNKPQGSKKTT